MGYGETWHWEPDFPSIFSYTFCLPEFHSFPCLASVIVCNIGFWSSFFLTSSSRRSWPDASKGRKIPCHQVLAGKTLSNGCKVRKVAFVWFYFALYLCYIIFCIIFCYRSTMMLHLHLQNMMFTRRHSHSKTIRKRSLWDVIYWVTKLPTQTISSGTTLAAMQNFLLFAHSVLIVLSLTQQGNGKLTDTVCFQRKNK